MCCPPGRGGTAITQPERRPPADSLVDRPGERRYGQLAWVDPDNHLVAYSGVLHGSSASCRRGERTATSGLGIAVKALGHAPSSNAWAGAPFTLSSRPHESQGRQAASVRRPKVLHASCPVPFFPRTGSPAAEVCARGVGRSVTTQVASSSSPRRRRDCPEDVGCYRRARVRRPTAAGPRPRARSAPPLGSRRPRGKHGRSGTDGGRCGIRAGPGAGPWSTPGNGPDRRS